MFYMIMKNKKYGNPALRKISMCTAFFLSANMLLFSQQSGDQTGNVGGFTVLGRSSVPNGDNNRIGIDASYKITAQESGKPQYQVTQATRGSVSVDALSSIA